MTDPRTAARRDLAPVEVIPPTMCRAHTSKGEPCKRYAIVGGFVCATHGGSAPQVRRKAQERIMALAPRAVQVLADLLEGADSEVVRLRAATELLDRGVGKALDVSVDITPPDEGPTRLALAIEAALAERGVVLGEVIDGDVVEDDPPSPLPHTVPASPLSPSP